MHEGAATPPPPPTTTEPTPAGEASVITKKDLPIFDVYTVYIPTSVTPESLCK